MSTYPKILFITDEIPQTIQAGSIQFYRLFKNYPSDKIIVFGKPVIPEASKLACSYYDLPFKIHERLRVSRLSSLLSDFQSLRILLPNLPKHLVKIANEFKPDIVISLMQNITYYYPAYYYAKKNDIPFVLFCHDDVEEFSNVHPFFKKKLTQLNGLIYQAAAKRICISPEMTKKWEIKYKTKGDYLYPIASDSLQPRSLQDSYELKTISQLTLGYAGSLSYGYREGIIEIIPIIEKTNTKIKIYNNPNKTSPKSPHLEYKGSASTSEETWERIKLECDAVILPYSSQSIFKELYKTHFPSKISEYLSLGMPIIINGPNYANGIIWAKKQKGVFAVTTNELGDILIAIKKKEIRINAINLLKEIEDFQQNEQINKFLNILRSI